MQLSRRSKIVTKAKRRLGRGYGSGRAKTSGRGTKGQKARGRIRQGFEGGQLALVKRLPYLRGKGRNRSRSETLLPVALDALDRLPGDSVVTVEFLVKHGIIQGKTTQVKILANGTLSKRLTVRVPCSVSAKKAIEQAGGTVE